MTKYFVIADVHGFYDEMVEALNDAGFDRDNPNHCLIACGDYFDRGTKPREVMDYLMDLPRKLLIRGNHECLLEECINHEYFTEADVHNGTMQTILDLAPEAHTFTDACKAAYEVVKDFLHSMENYVELENHILVHAWFPDGDEWRNAHQAEWDKAMWKNPYKRAMEDTRFDKTVVFGHWHTSYPRAMWHDGREWGDTADFSIYYGNGYIGLDASTAYSKKVNILVIEEL